MKPTIFKSILMTMMLLFACTSASFAQEYLFLYESVETEESARVKVYKMKENSTRVRLYKEVVVNYDEFRRPMVRSEKLWVPEYRTWVPCREFNFAYSMDSCVINLEWKNVFCQKAKDRRVAFSWEDAGFGPYPTEEQMAALMRRIK